MDDNSILLEVYSFEHQDRERFDGIEEWMIKAKALKIVNGERYVLFPKYNDFILKFLDEDREQIRTDKDESSATWHSIEASEEASDFFFTRHEFIHQLRHKYLCDEDADLAELRHRFKVVSPKFREIAERFVLAIDLELELRHRNQKPKTTRKKAKRKPQ